MEKKRLLLFIWLLTLTLCAAASFYLIERGRNAEAERLRDFSNHTSTLQNLLSSYIDDELNDTLSKLTAAANKSLETLRPHLDELSSNSPTASSKDLDGVLTPILAEVENLIVFDSTGRPLYAHMSDDLALVPPALSNRLKTSQFGQLWLPMGGFFICFSSVNDNQHTIAVFIKAGDIPSYIGSSYRQSMTSIYQNYLGNAVKNSAQACKFAYIDGSDVVANALPIGFSQSEFTVAPIGAVASARAGLLNEVVFVKDAIVPFMSVYGINYNIRRSSFFVFAFCFGIAVLVGLISCGIYSFRANLNAK